MKAPSTLLLRSFLRPHQPLCQVRWKSNWMPREKYAKVTALDKLHRRQKVAVRKERQDSKDRAAKMYPSSNTSPTGLYTPPNSQHPSAASQARALPPKPPQNLVPLTSPHPYMLLRTSSANLPIYESTKGGGTRHITTIRKIKGSLPLLAQSIRGALKLDEYVTDPRGRKKANVVVNHVAGQIIVRGWKGAEIRKWAEVSGF